MEIYELGLLIGFHQYIKMTDCIGLDGKSQLMLDFLEVKEQTNDYRNNILELLENDNGNSEILHYNEIVQCLN